MTGPLHRCWHKPVLVATLALAWLAASAWVRPLMLPDEGRYVGVAWEMLRSGDWLTPTLNGLPYFHKPPLFYWITAASMALFGPGEWAARAAPMLGAGLGALSLYFFVRRWRGDRAAGLALIALVVQPLFYLGAQFANLDMLVAGCITATILLLAHAALCVERCQPYRSTLGVAYAAAALGVLAKGLIGVVIPLLVVGGWLLLLARWHALRALVWWPGVALFFMLAAPWFVAMQARFDGFLDYFFVVQHFKRFAAGGFNNVQPFWFFPAVLIVFCLPWLPWLGRSLGRGWFNDPGREPVRLLMVLWAAAVVLFFSMPKSKLLGYVLPALPPLAFLMAEGFLALPAPSALARRLWWSTVAFCAVLVVGVVIGLAVDSSRSTRDLASVLDARRGAREPVFMLGNYYFDVPLYARIAAPVGVIDDWTAPDVPLRDNWRKELADAGRFAPSAAAGVLIEARAFPAAVCASPVSWVIGAQTAAARYPFLAHARQLSTRHGSSLWRLDTTLPALASALDCRGRPNGGSTGM